MRNFINRKINEIFTDFKKELSTIDNYCRLKNFPLDFEHTPDYNDKLIQKYYLLRYLPAYLTEYYFMYSDMLDMNFIDDKINVVSIGAGCLIDSWGLKFALDERDTKISNSYCGLDSVKWDYIENAGLSECDYLIEDINKLDRLWKNDFNVIVFPKSIGELDHNTFNKLKDIIANSEFIKSKLVVLSSSRKAKGFIDRNRVKEIVEVFENEHEYQCLDNNEYYYSFEKNFYDDYDRLEDICDKFTYPSDIINYLTTLNSRCKGYANNGYMSHYNHCDNMNKEPILETTEIEYQILRLER